MDEGDDKKSANAPDPVEVLPQDTDEEVFIIPPVTVFNTLRVSYGYPMGEIYDLQRRLGF